jgi:transposase
MYAAVTVTLNRDEMERRRLEAAGDLLKGITQARVARKFGVSRTTASRWYRTLEGQGMERLRKRKAPGRPSRLSSSQRAEVREMFAAGPGLSVLKRIAGPPPAWRRPLRRVSPSATIRITSAA